MVRGFVATDLVKADRLVGALSSLFVDSLAGNNIYKHGLLPYYMRKFEYFDREMK